MTLATKIVSFILLSLIITWSAIASADPPRHAPAHGWRSKHDPYYLGYSGRHWERDFEILTGHCNREAVVTVLGGVLGGVIGSSVADRDDRAVATIIGAAVGALIGNKIGRELDEADRSCIGHSLEVGKPGQQILWTNEVTGVNYEMTLGDEREHRDSACREFTLVAVSDADKSTRQGVACQSEAGVWKIEG